MVFAILLFIAGLALIIKGGDIFVDAAIWMSDTTGISRVVIGATVVSFATTSPEYAVSTIAAAKGYIDLSIGNAVGSLAVNLGIAFALLAIALPGVVKDRLFGAKGFMMLAAAALLWFFSLNGILSVWEALVLLAVFAVSVFVNVRFAKDGNDLPKRKTNGREVFINILKFVGSAAAIVFGSNLIVDNGKQIAGNLGVSDAIIGLTIVAVGTSLPEIVTSITAVVKKQGALSLGNVLGANLIDTTLILSTGSFISGGALSVSPASVWVDLPVAIMLMLLAVVPVVLFKKISRPQGIAMFALYTSYIVYTIIKA